MKKQMSLSIFLTVFVLGVSHAQNDAAVISMMDKSARELAGSINKKLVEEKAGKIGIGQFIYRGSMTPLGSYWAAQLTEELTNINNRPYIILSTGQPAAGGTSNTDWTVMGEIIEAAGVIRVYTRLIRSSNRAVEGAFHSDFERDPHIIRMLSSGGSNGHSSGIPIDEYEPDSWENPVLYEIGVDSNAPVMNRTLHDDEDEDFFLLLPDRDGQLVMETTGNIDTYMYFYDAETKELLDEDDDGGSSYNARIRYNVRAGKRYIAKVTGYSGATGHYGFRAYLP